MLRSVEEEELRRKLRQETALDVRLASDADTVQQLEGFIQRFVKMPTGLSFTVALWAIGTHMFDSFEVFPYLAITAPAKRCGKTRVTEVLELVCANAKRTANVSEAALFRLIHKCQPTLFIDEAEALADKRNERSQLLVGIPSPLSLRLNWSQAKNRKKTTTKTQSSLRKFAKLTASIK